MFRNKPVQGFPNSHLIKTSLDKKFLLAKKTQKTFMFNYLK